MNIGQLLQHIRKLYCDLCTGKAKNNKKNIRKDVCQAS